MFFESMTDLEKNQYKRSGKLKEKYDILNKKEYPEYYRAQRIGSYCEVFDKTCEYMIIPEAKGHFFYSVDPQFLFDTTRGYRFENFTPDYSIILDNGLESLKYRKEDADITFCQDYNSIVDSMIKLVNRILEKQSDEKIKKYFFNLLKDKASCFEEVLQRILFVNQLLWQMGHRLVGLGHLDWLLYSYYQKEMKAGTLNRDKAKIIMKDFLTVLHQYYWLKSNVLMGDTGQIIILGGSDSDGNYICNELTYLWIDALMELKLPDPKILLRVNQKMPRDLMELAVRCMETGIGSPILANDDVIIPSLLEYGIDKEDAYEYGTSACWEPLVPGKSISLNNISYLKYPQAFIDMLEEVSEDATFGDILNIYYQKLKLELDKIQKNISEFRLQYNPLLSVFMKNCFDKKKDASCGGAKYSNYGITTVGLANVVDSLLNIKKYVFEEKRISLKEVRDILSSNYEGYEELRLELKDLEKGYPYDDDYVIDLTNNILKKTTEYTEDFRNYLGGTLKFGVSAPTYIDAAKNFPATFDGRKKGEAFAVHISSNRRYAYTAIINFAAAIDYKENRFNGNVVDLMITPQFIEKNFQKFVDLLMIAIEVGFFQLQMNVVGSEVLIEAKKNPDKYPNLIVRVWGFSAYFNELPEEYQNVLIQRALENEGVYS